jgi:hypothetical protein
VQEKEEEIHILNTPGDESRTKKPNLQAAASSSYTMRVVGENIRELI